MRGKTKILHMSWMAFFISFVVWFNHAPLMMLIKQDLDISDTEVESILLLNVALTIPARVIIGMVVDRYGAKISYSVYWPPAACRVLCLHGGKFCGIGLVAVFAGFHRRRFCGWRAYHR